MLSFSFPANHRFCDGISRRDFIKVGALTSAGFGLADFLRLKEAGAVSERARAKSVILLYMGGGASHIDTFDLKPDAPSEYRGTFKPIPTNVPGISICEHLPLIAKQMDKMALVRSVHHVQDEHQQAAHFMLTGWMPSQVVFGNEHPSLGSVVAKETSGRFALPYVVIKDPAILVNRHHGASFLGGAYDPFVVQTPWKTEDIPAPPDTTLPSGITTSRMSKRRGLLRAVDSLLRRRELEGFQSADKHQEKVFDMMTSPQTVSAFDLSQESEKLRFRYGNSLLGQACLLARRLVEAGARFVTISKGGWDTHAYNFEMLDEELLPWLDRALSSLIEDLHERGLLDSTLVIWNGEFGRTPKINKDAGRDHWPSVMTMCLAGGGIQGGQVIGASDARGEFPVERPVTPQDVWVTMYHLLGINWRREYDVPETFEFKSIPRRSPILPQGEPIRELT
jgi:hypothetical protein